MKKEEQREQIALTHYLKILEQQNKILTFYAIPNGGSRNIREAANMKKEGVRAGISDMCVILKDKVLYIEMKKQPRILKSGKLSYAGIKVSDNQKKFIEKVNLNPSIVAKVCYGFIEAKKFIEANV